MRVIVLIVVLLLTLPVLGRQAPPLFGVPAGSSPQDAMFSAFNEVDALNPGVLALAGRAPPTPHSAFSQYGFQFHPESGVCWGQGISETFDSDRYGGQVRSAVDRIVDQLKPRYGNPTKVDLLRRGSIWSESENWTMALNKNERFYHYTWKDLSLGNGVTQIFIMARASGSSRTNMIMEWRFDNYDDCVAVGENIDREAF